MEPFRPAAEPNARRNSYGSPFRAVWNRTSWQRRRPSFPERPIEGYAACVLDRLASQGWAVATTIGDHDYSSYTLSR